MSTALQLGDKLGEAIGGPTIVSTPPAPTREAVPSSKPYPEIVGLLLLALALLFNAIMLAPEARIERVPVNDLSFHLEASQRLGESIAHREPFMDPWVSQWSLGFPLWRVYQPLPHLLAAGVIALARPFASPAASFAALYYVLLVLMPVSVYVGTRLMGLNPLAAGLASILILAPAEEGDFSRYGLSYDAYVWRGSGLFSELIAFEVMMLALGLVARAIDSGKGKMTAALALALTALSHVFFGYIAFVSIAFWALIKPGEGRSQRITRAVSISAKAMLLLAWFVIPMVLGGAEVNRSRWDPAYKFDSYGAQIILTELYSGKLLDFARLPILSLMVAAAALIAVFNLKDALARRLLVLTAVWLALYFGRPTWGHLLVLAGIPSQFHLHRLEAAFELFAVLLAAWGLERIIAVAVRSPGLVAIAMGAMLGGALVIIAAERVQYLSLNAQWGEGNLTAYAHERGDLDAALADVRAILAERPGRVSAGKAADWGGTFNIGSAKVYSFIALNGMDEASFLYHTISLTSEFMVLRDENDPVHEDLFGVRAVLAPVTLKLPPYFRKRGVHGRFAVYEASPTGYFSLVDVGARYDGGPATWFEPISTWLGSPMLHAGEVLALDARAVAAPVISRWQQLPPPDPRFMTPRGQILSETKVGEDYRASIDAQRLCYALIKITYHPGLVAWVDGQRAPLLRVSPDFGAIALVPGHHDVEVRYQPGPLKPLLLLVGLALFALAARPPLLQAWERTENRLQERLVVCGEWLTTDRVKIAIALALLILIFTRGLFRGQLIDGHDSLAYPPRITEFAKVIDEHQFPPMWAPDLSYGHGQPLFEFFPPLAYITELPLYKAGMSLADSIQFPLIILFAIGAIAVYLIGRRLSFSRFASVGAAAAWLFAPYQAIDVYVSFRVAEATAIALIPLALLALISVLDRPTLQRTALASFAIALVPLSHNVIALLMFPVFAMIVLARAALSTRPLRTAAAGAAAIAGGLGLSAFFWLPAMLEKGFVKTDASGSGFMHWSVHIIEPWQLLWGRWGYGLSLPGPNDGMSFALGFAHIALAIAGLVIGLKALKRTRRVDAIVFASAALAGAFMSTEWSSIIWRHAPILQYLQFPWRMECIPALFMPLLALYVFERIGPRASVLVTVLLVLVNLQHTQAKGYLSYDDEFYYPASIAAKGIETTMYWAEPHGVGQRLPYAGNGMLNSPLWQSVNELSWTSTSHEYSVVTKAPVTAVDSTNYFPGWTVLIDGHETTVTPAPIFGLISFTVPAGPHNIRIELRPTPVRRLAPMVSLFFLGILLSVLAFSYSGITWQLSRDQLTTRRTKIAIALVLGLIAAAATASNGKIAGLFAGVIMLAVICYALAPYVRPLITAHDSGWNRALIILASIAVLKFALLPFFPGFEGDLRLYGNWARQIAGLGPAHTYQPGFYIDYPPGYLYALWIAGFIARVLHASGLLMRMIVETPALLADFFLAASIYAFVRRDQSSRAALVAMLLVALNPALLYDTVVWGQSDSFITFTMLLSILALLVERYELGFALAAISVLVKPQGLMLLPVLALWTIRHANRQTWVRCMLAFVAAALIVITPFQIGHPWNWLIDLYSSTAATYHETSVNAFNLMALLGGLRMPDSNTIAGHSFYAIGMFLLVPLYAFIAWIIWTARTPRTLLFASFISIFGFFMLAPRMHERYVYSAIVLAAPLALEAPVMAAMFALLSLTGLVNLAYILHTIQLPSMPGTVIQLAPRDGLAMAVSALNLVVMAIAVYYGASALPLKSDAPRTDEAGGTDEPTRDEPIIVEPKMAKSNCTIWPDAPLENPSFDPQGGNIDIDTGPTGKTAQQDSSEFLSTRSARWALLGGSPRRGNYVRPQWINASAAVAAALLLCLVILVAVLQLWKADLRLPLYAPESDVLCNSVVIKSTIENGWWWRNARLGAPFGQQLLDWPFTDNLTMSAVKITSLFTSNYAVALNIVFLLTFPLTVLTSLFVLRIFGVSYPSAVVMSLLYAFIPYHFYRGELHLFLSGYYAVPFIAMTCIWLRNNELDVPVNASGSNRRRQGGGRTLLTLLAALLIASGNNYYAFFGCFLFCVAGVRGSLASRSVRPVMLAVGLSAFVALLVALNNAPSIVYDWQHGINEIAAQRVPSEAESYGLRISQMLLPVTGHRVPDFARLKEIYNSSSGFGVNENDFASLGALGAFGFLFLLGCILYRPEKRRGGLYDVLALLTIAALFLGTVSGFGSLFNFLITALFRCYNRISIYIAFFALFAVALLLDQLRAKLKRYRFGELLWIALLGAVLFFGILDQTTAAFVPPYQEIEASESSDAVFVKRIEDSVPPGAMIFQLPYVPFPENGTFLRMTDYALAKGYLHSKTLRWSYGAMKGRPEDRWETRVARLQPELLAQTLVFAGFSGIYIDRYGYLDEAKGLELALARITGGPPLVSPNGRLSFFNLSALKNDLRAHYTAEGWNATNNKALQIAQISAPQSPASHMVLVLTLTALLLALATVLLTIAVNYGVTNLARPSRAAIPLAAPILEAAGPGLTPVARFFSNRLVEIGIILICLMAIAARFYPTAGRFIDKDELYFFYLSHAVSRGGQLYSGLKTYYAPGLFYIGAALFILFRDLYAALLGARIFVITLGLLGFTLVFDIFRRLRLTWFILPAAFFVLLLTQFDLKLMEFRPDNILVPVLVTQIWLLFQLNEGTTRQDFKLLAIVLLGLLSVHLSQKAIFVEAAVFMALAATQFSALAALIRQRWLGLSVSVLLLAGTAAWSSSYRTFVFAAYIEPLQLIRLDYRLIGGGGAEFMWGCVKRNLGFWFLTALAVIFLIKGLWLNPRRYLPPLLLLPASCVLLYSSPFPYFQYQLYLTWAALLALPFALRVVCDLFPKVVLGAFAIVCLAALSSLFTFEFFQFPYQSLHEYAAMIDRAQREIGEQPVAFVGGSLITGNSVLPQDGFDGPQSGGDGIKFYRDYVVERRWNMRDLLQQTGAKFVFDTYWPLQRQALLDDRTFIGLNYRPCPASPLLIASRWHWFDANGAAFQVDIGGKFRTPLFTAGAGPILIDGKPAASGAELELATGTHKVQASAPGVLLTEFASPAIGSVDYQELASAEGFAFKSIDADFSGRFRLLGILRLNEKDADLYRVFWQKTSPFDAELSVFHHFRDSAGNFLHAENVDPGGGWYSLRELDPGQYFSYDFKVSRTLRAAGRLDVGLYFRDEIAKRLPCGKEMYYSVDLSSLR